MDRHQHGNSDPDLDRDRHRFDPHNCLDDNPDPAKKYRIRNHENVVCGNGTGYPYLRRHRTGTFTVITVQLGRPLNVFA